MYHVVGCHWKKLEGMKSSKKWPEMSERTIKGLNWGNVQTGFLGNDAAKPEQRDNFTTDLTRSHGGLEKPAIILEVSSPDQAFPSHPNIPQQGGLD